MSRGLPVAVFLIAISTLHASVQLLPSLPNGATSAAMQVDSSGNIYIAGSFVPTGKRFTAAFVTKLAPGGSKVLYFTPISGSSNDSATTLALGSDGSVYVGGNTFSIDFPVTPGALLSTASGAGEGFLARLNPAGAVVYSSLIGGTASTSITGMTLDSAGNLFLTGAGGPSASGPSIGPFEGFVLKLNAALTTVLLSAHGYGGGQIALDAAGNVYLAGSTMSVVMSTTGSLSLPVLASGVYQAGHDARYCYVFGSGPGGPGGSLACQYQYVAKLSATGAAVWATYLTGTYGATAAGMAVDSAGQVIVAGTTYSDDYPVTAGAFQTAYTAGAPTFPSMPGNTAHGPPPNTGYLTKLNASGTALVWSTYFGGSFADQITGMAVDATGDLVLSGYADSSDFPALAGIPDACHPSPNQVLGFVARLASDGATAGPTQLVQGAPVCTYFSCGDIFYDDYPNYPSLGPLALAPDGTVLFAAINGTLASVDSALAGRLACVVDPTDYVQLTSVAPGQLLAIFGADLAPAAPFVPASGVAPSTSTLGVFFNGTPAPILYSDAHQINLQVPFEIAGQSSVTMKVTGRQTPLPLSETLTLGVVNRQPSVYLTPAAQTSLYPAYTTCGGAAVLGTAALALNADGTLNDCGNPAAAGSTVILFVDGLGPVTPSLTTGAIATSPAVALTPAVAVADSSVHSIPAATLTIPGSITGIAQLQLQLPPSAKPGAYQIAPTLEGTPLRERLTLVWVKAK